MAEAVDGLDGDRVVAFGQGDGGGERPCGVSGHSLAIDGHRLQMRVGRRSGNGEAALGQDCGGSGLVDDEIGRQSVALDGQ